MQCKHHPDRQAEHFCATCGIPLCNDCSEEVRPDEYYCFQCAMLQSVSEVGSSIKDKRQRASEKKLKEKKKWGPFQYFVVASCVLLAVMWGVILFGGQKAPTGSADIAKNDRAFLFMVDSALKRYAHYERKQFPAQLSELVPRYLPLRSEDIVHLGKLSYQKDPQKGYRLSLARPKPGEMNIIISPRGIEYQTS